MRTLAVLSVVAFLVTSFVGCGYVAPVVPPQGFLYAQVKAPMDTNMDDTKLGAKKGEASSMSILGLIATGDAGVKAAAAQGNITTVTAIDYEYTNILGFYQKFTTIVYGD